MKKNIIEGNKLISKFIGISYDIEKELYIISESEWGNGYDDALLHLDNIANSLENNNGEDNPLLFNAKWDLFMPVCKKWDVINDKDILVIQYYSEYEKLCDKLDNEVSCYEIDDAWKQLVENIKWYNNL